MAARRTRGSIWQIGSDGVTRLRWRRKTIDFDGKWHPFICCLIATNVRQSGDDARLFVRPEQIAALPLWKSVKTTSVGATLARFINNLSSGGHTDLIDHDGLTRGWRLSRSVRSRTTVFDRRAASDALVALEHGPWPSLRGQSNVDLADWMIAACETMLATSSGEHGRAAKAYKQATDVIARRMAADGDAAHVETLEAITDVLGTRLRQAVPMPGPSPRTELADLTALELTALARQLSARVPRAPQSGWVDMRQQLYALVPSVTVVGDVASQAYLFNALFILERRLGNLARAEGHIRTAAPLAIHAADLHLIQAVSFNLANFMWEKSRLEGSAIATQCQGLFALDIQIRDQHGLGKNSAAAEQTLAFLALEANRLEACDHYLRESFKLIRKHALVADNAISLRIRGKLKLARAINDRGIAAALVDLQASYEQFVSQGRDDSAATVQAEIIEARERREVLRAKQ